MRPMFASLLKGFPSRDAVPPAALFEEIGWDGAALAGSAADPCAVRVSLALVRAGARIPGQVNVSRGRFKGQRIEPAPARLSLLLTHPSLLGRPEIYRSGAQAEAGIGQRRGIVSTWCRQDGMRAQGHIDIVGPDAGPARGCGGPCYREASEIWFWPLR